LPRIRGALSGIALPIEDAEVFEARLYFKVFYGARDLSLRAMLDITQFEKIYPQVQSQALLHTYSDARNVRPP